jgi:hypothetical protein
VQPKLGQCVLTLSSALFTWGTQWSPLPPKAAPDVWLHGLYIRVPYAIENKTVSVGFISRTVDYPTGLLMAPTRIWWAPADSKSTLWLTEVTTQGANIGLVAQGTALASGVPASDAKHCKDLCTLLTPPVEQ